MKEGGEVPRRYGEQSGEVENGTVELHPAVRNFAWRMLGVGFVARVDERLDAAGCGSEGDDFFAGLVLAL